MGDQSDAAVSLLDFYDCDLERAVVGAVLAGGKARYELLSRAVRSADFWLDGYGDLWRLLRSLDVVDFVTVSRAAKAHGLARCGIDEVDLARCVSEWAYRSSALVDGGFRVDGKAIGPDDLALRLAKQVHALATARRVGLRLSEILRRALGYADAP